MEVSWETSYNSFHLQLRSGRWQISGLVVEVRGGTNYLPSVTLYLEYLQWCRDNEAIAAPLALVESYTHKLLPGRPRRRNYLPLPPGTTIYDPSRHLQRS